MKKFILAILVLGAVFLIACSGDNELSPTEKLAFADFRVVVAQSAVDGSGVLSENLFNSLENIAKKSDSKNQWFKNYSGQFYAGTKDTSDREITFITDSTYVATFTIEIDSKKNYKLIDYTFEEKKELGYEIKIEKD